MRSRFEGTVETRTTGASRLAPTVRGGRGLTFSLPLSERSPTQVFMTLQRLAGNRAIGDWIASIQRQSSMGQIPVIDVEDLPEEGLSLSEGSKDTEKVKKLQRQLNLRGASPPLVVDGKFGKHTREAVVHFQRGHPSGPDAVEGEVNATLWQLLFESFPAAASESNQSSAAGSASSSAPGKLQPGDHVWVWSDKISTAKGIPRTTWFVGSKNSTDYGGHGTEIYEYVIYADVVKRGQPHMLNPRGSFAWLNNNPGNLSGFPGTPDFGEIRGKYNSTEGLPDFLVFPTIGAGFAAIKPFILNPHGAYLHKSIAQAMYSFCPPEGGDPVKYAKDVVSAIGAPVTLNTKVSELTDSQVDMMVGVIKSHEGTIGGDTLKRDDPRLPKSLRDQLE
jgi:peptidoglycan hydrolase-like protein with peptidoglycan-binding domain